MGLGYLLKVAKVVVVGGDLYPAVDVLGENLLLLLRNMCAFDLHITSRKVKIRPTMESFKYNVYSFDDVSTCRHSTIFQFKTHFDYFPVMWTQIYLEPGVGAYNSNKSLIRMFSKYFESRR